MTTDLTSIFGDAIHTYTTEQAIEDGHLVDARVGDYGDVTAQHFGTDPSAKVVLTRALHDLVERAVSSERHCNDFAGVWHDVLWMGRGAAAGALRAFGENGSTAPRAFQVIITGTGRRRVHTVLVSYAGDALTFGLQGDF